MNIILYKKGKFTFLEIALSFHHTDMAHKINSPISWDQIKTGQNAKTCQAKHSNHVKTNSNKLIVSRIKVLNTQLQYNSA